MSFVAPASPATTAPAPGSTSAAVSIRHLGKSYPARAGDAPFLALRDIDLEIHRGEFIVLLGPSGCGKSTLLHVIGGLVPAEGEVTVMGRAVAGPGFDRGIVFQDYALFPWRTVLDNVAFGLEIKRVPRRQREEIAQARLASVGLAGFEAHYPAQLSGGMKQRVAIARALAYDPDVLLMDEPFAALDAQTREILQGELLRIWRSTGKTVIFVTHSIDEAIFLATRVVVFTAQPGTIKRIVDVDLPAARDSGDLRSSPAFATLRGHLAALLAEEVGKAAERAYGRAAAAAAPSRGSARLWSRLRSLMAGAG
ncbi:taurine ABC transporter ATP binding subunit [Rhodovastum atsumiense]|uniref:ABC transporter ATP-binding protein n=1 Tax=Rhodovastum atsumiense TaxID=504468 RepID=A0A5M6IK03_9PROT|nr:ABC transporter ATP-binding protein [Rhodovastum atsumiense]KAA5608570.1 ABC transporter ATP-binding protein [Rhodovastum atsumiense]CAH2598790.1 taurine ABC transporter ATP binding subunit [Rhodovastum atsumiense]